MWLECKESKRKTVKQTGISSKIRKNSKMRQNHSFVLCIMGEEIPHLSISHGEYENQMRLFM